MAERPSAGATAKPARLLPENDYWMVGAYWRGFDPPDQTARFLEESIWENGYDENLLDLIKSMRVGDRIALKATTTQRQNLPFDAEGRAVSKMIVKAVGTVTHNPGNGYSVEVEWDPAFEPRTWYFYTSHRTVWRLRQDDPLAQHLIDFAFHGAEQDYALFVARRQGKGGRWSAGRDEGGTDEGTALRDAPKRQAPPYAVADVVADGAFLDAAEIGLALQRFRAKKNLILQGPPGVGKTFLARKLAYALMGARDDGRVATVQFHPSYSYEDFVRGYRPAADQAGAFALADGAFLRFCRRAEQDPDRDYVLIIDEINRGNLGQIFGELLMLLEADKRGAAHGIALAYPRHPDETVHVPENLYLLGTMNLADRSLAIVDYALRRRFAFLTLEPQFDQPRFREWLVERGMEPALVDLIARRMGAVNRAIAADPKLGPSYRIGHSVFIPGEADFSGLDRTWYAAVVKTEVAPLLAEYWYDDPQKATDAVRRLLA